jgi:integrase
MLEELEKVATLPTFRRGLRLYLGTMMRKRELEDATRDEVDLENAVWTIPQQRMKRSKAHNVHLSRPVLDVLIALKTCAAISRYFLPSRYDEDIAMSRPTFNRVTYSVVERAISRTWFCVLGNSGRAAGTGIPRSKCASLASIAVRLLPSLAVP